MKTPAGVWPVLSESGIKLRKIKAYVGHIINVNYHTVLYHRVETQIEMNS